jgi:hypothetical protein
MQWIDYYGSFLEFYREGLSYPGVLIHTWNGEEFQYIMIGHYTDRGGYTQDSFINGFMVVKYAVLHIFD